MTDDDRRKEEERKKKKEEERRKLILRIRERQAQELIHSKKHRTLHDKNRDRRKKDCMIGMPFIIAYQGDPAQNFFCNDVIHDGVHDYDLIFGERNFARLERYLARHVVTLHARVLIYKAPENLCPVCGIGNLKQFTDGVVRCNYCGYRPDRQFTKHA
jgi:hypothetical protein